MTFKNTSMKNSLQDGIPNDLTELEYARHILEFSLGWPSKGNLEMMADCITAVSKAKRLTLVQAYKYLVRSVELAKEQGIKVDRFWFQGGEYVNVRPKPKSVYEERPIPERLLRLAEKERQKMFRLVLEMAQKKAMK
jgi:hypothetical protein